MSIMAEAQEIEAKFWKALRSDMTLMLGLEGIEDGHAQPMTAQFVNDENHGPIWFFTSNETKLVQELRRSSNGVAHFVSKGHNLFATMHGNLVADNDPATIELLWNPFIAAWFEDGKDDPKLQLLRFDPERAQIWLNDSSLLAGIRMMLGRYPKQDYKDKVAEIELG
jgi:general stress protein 26